jgi:hypothetical protein
MPTYAWISQEGQWLTYSEQTTHTGTHKCLGLTTDLSQAYVGAMLPKFNTAHGINPNTFTAIPARCKVVRTVVLGECL